MNMEFFIRKKLILICFSLHQIKLIFEDEIIIEVGYEIDFLQDSQDIQSWNCLNSRSYFSINSLLNNSIIEASIDNSQNLNLKFENGEILIIKAAQDGNESFIVYNKKDFQVVY